MLYHRGFACWVAVDGTPVDEHLVAVEDGVHRVSGWIPSEEGKSFAVWFHDHGSGVDTCTFITLDGHVVPGRFLHGKGMSSRDGVRSGNDTVKPFLFAKVDESVTFDVKKEIGTIVVRIKRIERVGTQPANEIQSVPVPKANPMVGDHCINYGKEKKSVQHKRTWTVKFLDKPSTFVTFVFRYRSRQFLISQGIMPEDIRPFGPGPLVKNLPALEGLSAPMEIDREGSKTPTPQVPVPAQAPVPAPAPAPAPAPKIRKKLKLSMYADAAAKEGKGKNPEPAPKAKKPAKAKEPLPGERRRGRPRKNRDPVEEPTMQPSTSEVQQPAADQENQENQEVQLYYYPGQQAFPTHDYRAQEFQTPVYPTQEYPIQAYPVRAYQTQQFLTPQFPTPQFPPQELAVQGMQNINPQMLLGSAGQGSSMDMQGIEGMGLDTNATPNPTAFLETFWAGGGGFY